MFHMLMAGRFGLSCLLLVGALVGAGFCQEGPNPPDQPAPRLQIAFDSAPSATVGEPYHFRLLAEGGEFTITVVPPLEIEWTHEPQLQEDGIYGAVKVSNASGEDNDLTVIIVAVNQIGKAFALGYQRLTLAKSSSQEIPFGASLPIGTYIVHADAVAEIPSKNVIRRTRLHTPAPLVKSQ